MEPKHGLWDARMAVGASNKHKRLAIETPSIPSLSTLQMTPQVRTPMYRSPILARGEALVTAALLVGRQGRGVGHGRAA